MVSWACEFDSFGCKNTQSKKPSNETDIIRLMALISRAKIFPINCSSKRIFEQNLWWDLVKKPKDVGSKCDMDKESVKQSATVEILSNVFEKTSDNRDFKE